MKDRQFLPKTANLSVSRPPWVDLLSQAAERLDPGDETAMAQCLPWSVWVDGCRMTVVYESPALEDPP
jgi:hypothetical protein